MSSAPKKDNGRPLEGAPGLTATLSAGESNPWPRIDVRTRLPLRKAPA